MAGFAVGYALTRPIERARILAGLRHQGINHIHHSRAETRRCEYCRPTKHNAPRYKLQPNPDFHEVEPNRIKLPLEVQK